MIIVSPKTYDSEINFEYPADWYTIIFQSKSFITARILIFKRKCYPIFQKKCHLYSYYENAINIMDILKAFEEISEESATTKTLIHWIVPDASEKLQMLDVWIFGYQKHKYSHFRPSTK